ncbi:CocE/NonD family hydrolase [Nocardia sp. NPDC056952]|uniref:CocE/NonD family hydrolase n=1 Tax=Nocardia sp. NPDC056952 TaxID=3345979 RepID=UPI0036291BD9
MAVLLVFASGSTVASAAPDSADPGLAPAAWTATYDGPQPYPDVNIQWDVPLTMSDGTVLKADVYRPADASRAAVADKTPVLINITPYGKLASMLVTTALSEPVLVPFAIELVNSINFTGTPIAGIDDLKRALSSGLLDSFGVDQQLVKSGYTYVVVDARGTGFSQGQWNVLRDREQQDTIEVLEWARTQPWSNGKLGMTGISYSGINQLQAAAQRPAGLEAIFPVVAGADIVRDVLAPGGGFGITFIAAWLASVNQQKLIPDVQSMLTGHFDWKWLGDRVSDPVTYVPQVLEALLLPSVDQMSPLTRDLITAGNSVRDAYSTPLDQIEIPTMAVAGWNDLFLNTGARMLDDLTGVPDDRKKLIIGDGYHFTVGSDMGGPGEPPRINTLQKAWFDKWLKGIDNGIDRYAPATIHSYGNGWVQSDDYPVGGQSYRRLYLNPAPSGTAAHAVRDGSLTTAPGDRRENWTISPGLSTICSRDAAQASVGVLSIFTGCAEDNRLAESNALSFTSSAVSEPTRISGRINVHLNTTTETPDGYFSVMVTDVAPDGTSTVVSSGQLVSTMRRYDPSKSVVAPNGDMIDPFYEIDISKPEPVVPGQPTVLEIGSHATDLVLRPGHRLRVDVFALNLLKGLPTGPSTSVAGFRPETVVLDPSAPSWVNVPSDRPIA